jgi:hypothetical protein
VQELDTSRVPWRKSSRSSDKANCVEVGLGGSVVGVRDTKDRDGGTLVFSVEQWAHFVQELR